MKKILVISSASIFMILALLVLLLFARKHHALSDEQLIQNHWKAYKGCSLINFYTMQPADLQKIDTEWKTSYRWIDNTVFLHIKDDAKFGNCVYIAK